MAVNSVGAQNNNTALYTAGAGLAGAGIGGTIGYLRKPYLDGENFSDSFVKKVADNISDCKDCDQKTEYTEVKTAIDGLKDNDSINKLQDAVKNNDAFSKSEGKTVKELLDATDEEALKKMDLAATKESVTKELTEDLNKTLAKKITGTWDSSKKAFVESKDAFNEYVQKLAKGMRKSSALLWGGVGAAVLALGTFLATHNSSKGE